MYAPEINDINLGGAFAQLNKDLQQKLYTMLVQASFGKDNQAIRCLMIDVRNLIVYCLYCQYKANQLNQALDWELDVIMEEAETKDDFTLPGAFATDALACMVACLKCQGFDARDLLEAFGMSSGDTIPQAVSHVNLIYSTPVANPLPPVSPPWDVPIRVLPPVEFPYEPPYVPPVPPPAPNPWNTPAGHEFPPPVSVTPTVGIVVDLTNQAAEGVLVYNSGCAASIIDLDNNPFALFRHVYKLNGDVLFRITAMGAQAAASFVFDQWHASLNNVNTIARITALFSGTMDANGYTFIDHRYNGQYGLHAELVIAGFMPLADYDPTLSSNGFARTIDATVEYGGVVSPVIAYGVNNTIYKCVQVEVSAIGQLRLDSASFAHALDLSALYYGINLFYDGGVYTFNLTSVGKFGIWGLKEIGTFTLKNNNASAGRAGVSSVDLYYNNFLNGTIDLESNVLTTFLIGGGTGSLNKLSLSYQYTILGTGLNLDLSMFTGAAIEIGVFYALYANVKPPVGTLKYLFLAESNANRSVTLSGSTYIAAYYHHFENLPNMSVANIDALLVALDGITPGVATGTIDLSGTTPGPTGGAANANVLSLQAKGITVNL